jgi:hypothetical protein
VEIRQTLFQGNWAEDAIDIHTNISEHQSQIIFCAIFAFMEAPKRIYVEMRDAVECRGKEF